MTKKPFKVLSTTAMAAALVTSAIAPAAVFAAEDNVVLSISDFVITHEGELYSASEEIYFQMKSAGLDVVAEYILVGDKAYSVEDYLFAKGSSLGLTVNEALQLIAADDTFEQDITFGQVVVEDGEIKYVPATPEVGLAVESVSAINLKNITVTFSKEVDKDSVTAANAKVYDGTTLLSGVTLNLLEDGKTLLISNNGTYTQNKDYRVVVQDVKEKGSDVKVTSYDETVKVLDTTLPTVESVNVLSPKTVEILFSEPIQVGTGAGQFPTAAGVLTNIVQVDGINLYATPDTTKVITGNKVTLTLNTALTTGDHKVKVNNLNDFANLPITEKEFNVTVAEDTVAPEATAVQVINKNKVQVTFNEPVDNASVQANFANIKVNGTAVTAAVTKDGGTSYELTLGADLNLGAVVESTLEYKGIKDNYGNTVTTAKTIKFTAADDITAPVVANTEVKSDNSVEVTFSEDVTGFTGTSTVELYDKDNKKVSNTVTVAKKSIKGVPSDSIYTLTIANAAQLSGNYSLKILKDNVTDLSIRENKFAETTLSVTFNDKVAPKVTKAEFVNEAPDFNSDGDVKDSKLTIYFSEAMDAESLTTKSNYLIAGAPLADVAGATLAASSDNKSVTITVNRGTTDTQLAFATNTDVRVIAVKDAAGNTLDASQVNTNLGTGGASLISGFVSAPVFTDVVDKVEAIAKNQVKVTAKAGNTLVGIDANKIKFTESQSTTDLLADLQVTSVAVAEDGKTAVLTLNKNTSADVKLDGALADGADVVTLYADAGAITLSSSAKTAALAVGSAMSIADKIAASIDLAVSDANSDGKIDVDNADGSVTFTFDEAVASTVADLQASLVIKDKDGNRLVGGTGYTVAVDTTGASSTDATVKITFAPHATADYVGSYTIALTDNVVLKDTAGNNAKDFSVTTNELTIASQASAAKAQALLDLGSSITAAQQAHDAVVAEGSALNDTIVGSKATLDAAIATATAVKNNPASTTAQLGTAKTDLDNAKSAFDSAKVTAVATITTAAVTVAAAGTNSDNVITLGAGETLVLTSSDLTDAVATVTEDPTGTVKVTGVATGGPITITVEVKKDGQVVRTGTFTVTTS